MSDQDHILVKTLHITEIDNTHNFVGLSKLKMNKKERHMKTLRDFAKFLEITNENVVQEVLTLSRNFRETMEVLDEELIQFCKNINEDSYLLPKSEKELIHILEHELKVKIQKRSDVVESFAADLDYTETKRATKTSVELKNLVDQLISIAHQLPDDIEHIVENEAFELNHEIIANKNSHSKTSAEHQIKQVTIEATCLQQWENCRLKWRSIRHEQALYDFRNHIASSEFTDPLDRQKYMQRFRKGQSTRNQKLLVQFDKLKKMTCLDIASDAVQEIQGELSNLSVEELNAIQSCYNELIRLQGDMNFNAKDRVESLRRELHIYGALKIEPDLKRNSKKLSSAINDEGLNELWRLGGGLKSEFQAQVADLVNPDVIYNRMIVLMQNRMEFIISSFNLKSVLEERGRLAQLDKVRSLITKMRTVPRNEVTGVLNNLLPELNDIEEIESISEFFKDQIRKIIVEITTELSRPSSATISGTQNLGKSSSLNLSGTKPHSGTSTGTLNKTGTKKLSDITSKEQISDSPDPVMVKNWNRKLGILYYGSDLPKEYQQACLDSLELIKQQNECNDLVDIVVLKESEVKLKYLDKNYKKLIDQITTFLETQTSSIAQIATNIGDFFLIVAKMVEHHHKQQKLLDEKSADEIWDLREEFRLEREDNEEAYKKACQKIRESTKQDELQDHFENVLKILDQIAQSYRNYHSNACFANDKYPLMLIHEFRSFLNDFCKNFFLVPDVDHAIISEYERIFDQTIRLNRKFFGENILIVGDLERISIPDKPTNPYQTNLEVSDEDIKSNIQLSPYLQDGRDAPQDVYCGSFYWIQTNDDIVTKFKNESSFSSVSEQATSNIDVVNPNPTETNTETSTVNNVVIPIAHSLFPYITENCPVLPLSNDKLKLLDRNEIEEYELTIIKHFIDIGDRDTSVEVAPIPVVAATKTKSAGAKAVVEVVPTSPLDKMSNEELELYRETKTFVIESKARIMMESETTFILKNPPLDVNGQPWILALEISSIFLMEMISRIRDNILETVEREAFHRVFVSEKQNNSNKLELTEELEDRIRNHWPRRGRVETQIKQPREAELLGHKEKTWRHITNIQNKMIQAQTSFKTSSDEGHNECNNYINNMTNLRNSLNGDFKNLAFLQAIDVKARGLTLDFQTACTARKTLLNKIAEEETAIIVNFAKDFRKICPLQVPGIEGGYSESEILEIEALVIGQCEEIEIISKEWQTNISLLVEEQQQSFKSQDEFTVRYKKATQDVAMSEGLGQKYGAPRRRAQETIRTEISHDEKHAGKLDSLLAELEFACSEAERLQTCEPVAAISDINPELDLEDINNPADILTGSTQLYNANKNWNLLLQVREIIYQRAKYLCIIEKSSLPEINNLSWLSKERILLLSQSKDSFENENKNIDSPKEHPTDILSEVFEKVDKNCRKETKELYDSEGLSSVLGVGGVPESLQQWLTESKEKLLGRNGYREKTWKRLWVQVQRSENILSRHLVLVKKDEKISSESTNLELQSAELHDTTKYVTKLGIPAVCIKSLCISFIDFASKDKVQKEAEFSQLLRVWELGRDKHERLLRPRLGSPDLADELSQLNKMELERSAEMTNHVGKFRTLLIRSQTEHIINFIEDIGICCKGLLELLDTTIRQELLQVPPDTEVPKKHMTLKKLRKMQRIKELAASGVEDVSQKRTWAGINLDTISKVIRSAEDLVVDLGSNPRDTAITELPNTTNTVVANDKKAAKKVEKNTTPTEVVKASLITNSWISVISSKTSIKSEVSTAHRIILSERDTVIAIFTDYITKTLEEIRADYDLILIQEKSWSERWARQVDILRAGNI